MSTVLPAKTTARMSTNFFGPIAKDLGEVERVFNETLKCSRPSVARLVEYLENYRGKRLRPSLLLLTARACGSVRPAHYVLGAVVEMIHTATLVHDDVLDEASVRRYKATVNAGWGNKSSILLGDFLFTHAFHLSSTLDDVRACRLIGEATNRVCEGELQQITQRGNWDLTEEQYFDIIDGKTAELTSCCCRLGALFTDCPPETVESMASYGRWLGVAFQIADDLIDLVGEERSAGKSLGTDLEQQKLTLPLIHLLANASSDTRRHIQQLLNGHSNQKRESIRTCLVESGALAYASQRADEFASRARSEIECLPSSECKTLLEVLTARVVRRDK